MNYCVWIWGYIGYGLLGNGQTKTNLKNNKTSVPQKVNIASQIVMDIKSGNHHVCAITDKKEYWFWGLNTSKQICGLCKCAECDNNRELDFLTKPHLVSFALDNVINVYLGKWRTALIIDQ